MAVAAASTTGCIDEDLSKCGIEYPIEYRLHQALSLRGTLDDELTSPAELVLKDALEADMEAVLRDKARKFDLSFFASADGSLHSREVKEVDADQLSLILYMQPDSYENIALAATESQTGLSLRGGSTHGSLGITQEAADTVAPHAAGVFMGRERIDLSGGARKFFVELYRQNSVPVLVIDCSKSSASILYSYVKGTATALNCADSTFTFERPTVMRTARTDAAPLTAFHTVCFPSHDRIQTGGKARQTDKSGIWEIDVYTKNKEGKYTKNDLHIRRPLEAGSLMVIKATLTDDGKVLCNDPEVGVSVELDWKPGGSHDVEI